MRMYDVLSRQDVSAFVQRCLTKQSTKALYRLLITCHTNSVTQVQNSVDLLCLLNFLNFAFSNLILLLLLNNSVHFSPLQHQLISVYDAVRINAILVSSLLDSRLNVLIRSNFLFFFYLTALTSCSLLKQSSASPQWK